MIRRSLVLALFLGLCTPLARAAEAVLGIEASGLTWQGAAVDRAGLRAALEAAVAADPALSVQVTMGPGALPTELFWVTGLLQRSGVGSWGVDGPAEVEPVAAGEPTAAVVEPPAPAGEAGGGLYAAGAAALLDVSGSAVDAAGGEAGRASPASALRATGQLRAAAFGQTEGEALVVAVPASFFGVEGPLGGGLSVRATARAEASGGYVGLSPGELALRMKAARGWSVEAGHGAPLAQDRVAFDALAEGFALVSLAPAPMAMLAGRLPELGAHLRVDQRSEKLRASAQLQQQGNTPVAAGRLEGGSGLVGHAGGQVGLDGGGETALFGGVGLRQARFVVEGQALLVNEGEVSAICLEGAGRLHLGSPVKGVDDLVLVGRFGHDDPSLSTDDADAWMRGDVGLQLRKQGDAGVMGALGIGYGVVVPINVLLPIEHSVGVVQALDF